MTYRFKEIVGTNNEHSAALDVAESEVSEVSALRLRIEALEAALQQIDTRLVMLIRFSGLTSDATDAAVSMRAMIRDLIVTPYPDPTRARRILGTDTDE